ncbi:MAG TPA: LPS export ABC transporter ATP-binding protein [Methylocella sp.]|nr:LPS export ABC transporter ATP-binding protein [Methylocella sp.]
MRRLSSMARETSFLGLLGKSPLRSSNFSFFGFFARWKGDGSRLPQMASHSSSRTVPPVAAHEVDLFGFAAQPAEDFGKTPESDTRKYGKHALIARGLRKSYKSRRVIEDVSMTVRRGEVVGLLGPNGAGKTTLFYMITGSIRPDRGAIELDGHDVTRLPMYRRARLGIGYLPQEASVFRGLSVEDNIRAVLEIIEPDKAKRAADLEALLEEFDIKRLRKVPSIALSGGERRRCEIARALAGRPSFMLLDEPFAGIDPIAVGDIQVLIHHLKQRGIGVLITDHNVRETLGLIDRAYIVHAGRILVEGTPAEIVQDEKVRRFYLGEGFRL